MKQVLQTFGGFISTEFAIGFTTVYAVHGLKSYRSGIQAGAAVLLSDKVTPNSALKRTRDKQLDCRSGSAARAA